VTGSARAFFADPVAFVRGRADGAAPLRLRAGRQRFAVVRSSDDAWGVLVSDADGFVVGKWKRRARRYLGPTLNTLDGRAHRERRLLLQPALDRRRVAAAAPMLERHVEQALAGLRSGARVDVRGLVDPLSLRIACRFLLGADLGGAAPQLAADLAVLMAAVPRVGPAWRLGPGGRAHTRVVSFASGAVAARRATGDDDDDLLGVLVASGLPDEVVHGEIVAFLLAAADEPPSALAAAVSLLGRRPDAQDRLVEELGRAGPGDSTPYLDAVLREALRLYPPARHVDRCPVRALDVGGSRLERGTNVIVSPLVLHRDAGVFEQPDAFRPERWLEGRPEPPRGAYVPFGAGVHTCIGEPLATAIVRATLRALVLRWSLYVDDDAPPPEPRRPPLHVELRAR